MEGSDKLVAGLKEINDTSKELKREEIALGMRIHEENLRYKQDKDKLHIENSRIALLNQSAVVAAMTSLAEAIRSVRAPTTSTVDTTTTTPTDMGPADREEAPANTAGGRATCM